MKKRYEMPTTVCLQIKYANALMAGSADHLFDETAGGDESLSRIMPRSIWDDEEEGEEEF